MKMHSGIFTTLKTTVLNKFNVRQIRTGLNSKLQKVKQKVVKFLTDIINTLMKKPKDKSDYVKVGKVYLSKRFLIISSTVLAIAIFAIAKYVYPWADGHLWTANVKVNSKKYSTFSGKAKLKDKNGYVIYKGDMVSGKIEGYGTQYDLNGNVIYIGDFVDSQYSGKGELYNENVIVYRGDFEQSLYQGSGQLFDKDGNTTYSGEFAMGQKSGKGVEYNASTGLKRYYGEFANDLREGKGTEYGNDGSTVVYEGDFLAGQYGGEGKLYKNGVVQYVGAFANGLYEGEGTLYDVDSKSVKYIGSFVAGLYQGTGSLYDINTKKVIYTGEFEAGYRKGAGESYDRLGGITFSGDFRDDNIDYINYIGKDLDEVKEQFGKESYKTTKSDVMVLTYLGIDTSIVFREDKESGKFSCEKFIMGIKYPFKGLTADSTKEEIEAVMGKSFSSINFKFPDYYDISFNDLSINLRSKTPAPSDKFLMDNYFVRFYYNADRSEIRAIEVASI